MKIKCVDIASFGKFKNFHLDLTDGLTVIFGENEKGKTTLMAFIRMMFYGNTGKASGIDKNPRKKYRPWNSDLMAGSITFEHEGVTYRLEREFKSSNSTDKISLINLDLNEKQSISGSDDIGAKFFGLTDGAFERSVFIAESSFSAKNESADGEINARLSNIASTGDDDVSAEKVFVRLRTAKEALLSKSRKIGKLDKATASLQELSDKIKVAKETEDKVLALKDSAAAKEQEIADSTAAASLLFDQLKNSDKIKKRNFVLRYIEAEKERATAKEKLTLKDGSFADKAYILSLKEKAAKIVDAKAKVAENSAALAEKEKDIAALGASLAAMNTADNGAVALLEEKLNNTDKNINACKGVNEQLQAEMLAKKSTKKNNLPLIIVGVVIALLGGAAFLLLADQLIKTASLCAAFAGVVLFVLGFVIKAKVLPDTTEISAKINENSVKLDMLLKEKETVLEEISKVKAQNNALQIEAASKSALINDKKADLDILINETEKLSALKVAAEEDLATTLGLLKVTNGGAEETISALENALSYYDMISSKISVLADNAACSSLSEAEAKLEAYNKDGTVPDLRNEEIDALKERFRAQTDYTGTLKTELTAINEQIKSAVAATPPVAVLEREQEELLEKIKAYAEFTEISDLALSSLDEAFRDLRKNYSEVLDQRTAEIFTKLSSDKYLTVSVSKSMEPSVTTEDAFGTKEADYLSGGTEDQLYLAMRLAVAELITNEGEKLPIFADDPLSQYDDGRVLKATAFLKDYARDKQLVMFTCHSFIKDTAEKLGIKTIDM